MGRKKILKGEVEYNEWGEQFEIEFGRTQADMSFSANGTIQRALRVKHGNKVKITIEKVK